jgi:hypothetical protein
MYENLLTWMASATTSDLLPPRRGRPRPEPARQQGNLGMNGTARLGRRDEHLARLDGIAESSHELIS